MRHLLRTAAESIPSSNRHSVRHRPDIDGLRALAIIPVVLFHVGMPGFSGGFVGVDIFFVISGYLVGGHVYQEVSNSRFSYSAFYVRRVKRIIPALVAMILVISATAALLTTPDELFEYSKSTIAVVFGLSNIQFWRSTNYFSPSHSLDLMLMTWSLSVEEQFYLLLPVGLLVLMRGARRYVATLLAGMVAISLAAFLVVSAKDPISAFYLLPFRLWELGIGTLISVVLQTPRAPGSALREWLGLAGAAAMLTAILFLSEASKPSGIAVAVAAAGAASSLSAQGSWINRRVLSSMPMVAVGLVSYSWYLWHWPLITLVRLGSYGDPSSLSLFAAAGLSLLIACFSWRYIEQPFRTTNAPGLNGTVLFRYARTLAMTAALPALLYGCSGLPWRIGPDSDQITGGIAKIEANPCLAGRGDLPLNLSASCISPDRDRVALIGDSHATMLAESLRDIAKAHGLGIETFTKSTCPTLIGLAHSFPAWPSSAQQCASHNAQVLTRVAFDPSVRIVFMTASWGEAITSDDPNNKYLFVKNGVVTDRAANAEEFEKALRETILLMERNGKKVVVFDDVPIWKFDPLQDFYVTRLPLRRSWQRLMSPNWREDGQIADLGRWVVDDSEVSQGVRRSTSSVPGAIYVPLKKAFCSAATCQFRAGNMLYFFDRQHLTRDGADLALRHFDISNDRRLWQARAPGPSAN